MAADGTDQRQLTTTAGLDEGPAWSPSGSRIAFTSTRSGSSDIWTMAADGTDQRPLTALPGTEESPDWQPLPGTPAANGALPLPAPGAAPSRRASRSAPRLTLVLRAAQSLRTVRRAGLVVRVRCSAACGLDARLLRDGATVGRARGSLRAAGTKTVTIRLTARARARLAHVTRATLTLRVAAIGNGRRRIVRRRVTLTRTGAISRRPSAVRAGAQPPRAAAAPATSCSCTASTSAPRVSTSTGHGASRTSLAEVLPSTSRRSGP
jgi:hypothetical protein